MKTTKLTKNEIWLIADILNGHSEESILDSSSPAPWVKVDNVVSAMDGYRPTSGIELSIHDSMRLDGTDLKWNVDGEQLIDKIKVLSEDQLKQVILGVLKAWEDGQNMNAHLSMLEAEQH